MPMDADPADELSYVRTRIANACDGCKARKVKCDGKQPCSYCTRRRRPHTCRYSPPRQRRRRTRQSELPCSPPASARESTGQDSGTPSLPPGAAVTSRASGVIRQSSTSHGSPPPPLRTHDRRGSESDPTASEDHDETEVPLEARLLCDAQGKLIFIGDCAPLSWFQSVRQLVSSRVDQSAFAPQTSRYSMLENVHFKGAATPGAGAGPPAVKSAGIEVAVHTYLSVTSGLVDLFVDNSRLLEEISAWADDGPKPEDIISPVHYLVLAIGLQKSDEDLSRSYFDYARDHAMANLSGNLSAGTAQALTLVTLYMLGACQINEAFLYFGIAVRAAYSIGIHRTEVNSRFGPEAHRQRDRLWKSLRVVDLFLSTSMGRPPATSDMDCSVPYRSLDGAGQEVFDLLNASVQIFLIIEGVVAEIYSRRKISLLLTEGISRQLRDWSVRWLQPLKDAVAGGGGSGCSDDGEGGDPDCPEHGHGQRQGQERNAPLVVGACQILATYYYSVMLVSRPFLMYELHRRLSTDAPTSSLMQAGLISGKSKLADACIDAASLMVDPVLDLIDRGIIIGQLPFLVSWLFAASLVLGVGLLGGFGRILEKYTRMSITALEHLAKSDAHAMQYSLIGRSLLQTALDYLEKREVQERLQRTESSSQLFGLLPHEARSRSEGSVQTSGPALGGSHYHHNHHHNYHHQGSTVAATAVSPFSLSNRDGGGGGMTGGAGLGSGRDRPNAGVVSPFGSGVCADSPRASELDSTLLALSTSLPRTPELFTSDDFSALNLFPLLDSSGNIDLANYV